MQYDAEDDLDLLRARMVVETIEGRSGPVGGSPKFEFEVSEGRTSAAL